MLALGMGANTAIFTFMGKVFRRAAGFPRIHRAKHTDYREIIGNSIHIGLRDKVHVEKRDKVHVGGATKFTWKSR